MQKLSRELGLQADCYFYVWFDNEPVSNYILILVYQLTRSCLHAVELLNLIVRPRVSVDSMLTMVCTDVQHKRFIVSISM